MSTWVFSKTHVWRFFLNQVSSAHSSWLATWDQLVVLLDALAIKQHLCPLSQKCPSGRMSGDCWRVCGGRFPMCVDVTSIPTHRVTNPTHLAPLRNPAWAVLPTPGRERTKNPRLYPLPLHLDHLTLVWDMEGIMGVAATSAPRVWHPWKTTSGEAIYDGLKSICPTATACLHSRLSGQSQQFAMVSFKSNWS